MDRSITFAAEGLREAKINNFRKAVHLFSQAIDHNDDDYRFYINRAYCYDRLDLHDTALIDAERAIYLKPRFPKGYFLKGRALCGLKRYAEAELAFRKVLDLDSTLDEAKAELVQLKLIALKENPQLQSNISFDMVNLNFKQLSLSQYIRNSVQYTPPKESIICHSRLLPVPDCMGIIEDQTVEKNENIQNSTPSESLAVKPKSGSDDEINLSENEDLNCSNEKSNNTCDLISHVSDKGILEQSQDLSTFEDEKITELVVQNATFLEEDSNVLSEESPEIVDPLDTLLKECEHLRSIQACKTLDTPTNLLSFFGLHAHNISSGCSVRTLQQIFSKYGTVIRITINNYIKHCSTSAQIDYDNPYSPSMAIADMVKFCYIDPQVCADPLRPLSLCLTPSENQKKFDIIRKEEAIRVVRATGECFYWRSYCGCPSSIKCILKHYRINRAIDANIWN